jgi:aspartate-semialdehyde dehydrogenase
MAVTVGRVRPCPILDLRLVLLGHNTVRGAAGQGVQIAELLVADGRVGARP